MPLFGAAGWFAAHYANKMYFANLLKKRAWHRWLFRSEELGVALMHAQTEVAVIKQEMSDLVVEVPEPFEGTVMELARFGYNFEVAALRVATARGCYHLSDPAYYRPPPPDAAPETASCEALTILVTPEAEQAPQLPEVGSPSMPPPSMPATPRAGVPVLGLVWSPSVGAFVRA